MKATTTLRYAISVLIFMCSSIISSGQECVPGRSAGQWSVAAADLCTTVKGTVPDFTRDLRVYSEGKKYAVHVVKNRWWVENAGKRLPLAVPKAYVGYPAELAWALDGKAFYITWSNGSIAGFVTEVYRIDDHNVEPVPDLNRIVQKDFNLRHECVFYDKGKNIGYDPNVVGLKWADNSTSGLVVVAEIPPDSLCGEGMGYFGGYLISIPGEQILKRYSPEDLFQQFGKVMGQRLRGDFSGLTGKQRSELP
ncbi:MAG: hypothetical protein ACYDDI_05615 [Candidatus Acidiferrales bacterium]